MKINEKETFSSLINGSAITIGECFTSPNALETLISPSS